jgi:hypothetical protein
VRRRSRNLIVLGLACLFGLAVAIPAALLLRGESESAASGPNPAADGLARAVTGDFEPDSTTLVGCTDTRCYEQALGNVAFDKGPRAALRRLASGMQTTEMIKGGCHRMAHVIGAAALARYDGNIARALSEGDATCWSGYYHGVLERAFSTVKTREQLADKTRSACADEGVRRVLFVAYQCVHGLGHGLMIRTGYDLPVSLETCDELTTNWDRTSCHGGVFMENISSSYGIKSKWLRDDNLAYPCPAVAERHKLYCYLMVTSRMLQANGFNWRQTARLCAKVERNWIVTCFQSFGRDASGFSVQDTKKIAALCDLAGRYEVECLVGGSKDLTANDAGGDRAAKLCAQAARRMRDRCYHAMGSVLGGMVASEEARRDTCARLAGRYGDACYRGSIGG